MGSTTSSAFAGADIPSYDFIVNCMHCGLCLPHCPTFELTGLEKSSLRGRIRLIKAVADGELQMTNGFVEEMNFCLDCQACETACPAGVKYGALVEAARTQIYEQGREGWLTRLAKRWLLNWSFERPARFKFLASVIGFYQNSGLEWFFKNTGLLKFFSPRLHELQILMPRVSGVRSSERYAEVIRPTTPVKHRVGFLTGCIMDVAYANVNADTIELLLHHGCEVVIPSNQVCCGSLQAHHGGMQTARSLAERNIKAFTDAGVEVVVMNSAGCGAFMKEYGHLFEHHDGLALRAKALSAKVKDITEFLAGLAFRARAGGGSALRGKRVTYHDACHLVHTQKVSREPRKLINAVPGVHYVELPESTWCCGSAGIYNVTRYDDSMKLLDRKLAHIRSVMPDVIVTGNPGCMAQMEYGLKRSGLKIEVMHTATFLRRACEA
jgi:glycolate oxidase iron-sulfur subunit